MKRRAIKGESGTDPQRVSVAQVIVQAEPGQSVACLIMVLGTDDKLVRGPGFLKNSRASVFDNRILSGIDEAIGKCLSEMGHLTEVTIVALVSPVTSVCRA